MIQKLKGTYDLTDNTAKKVLYLKKIIESLMNKYNYNYIETPVMEQSELFHRTVGETTDIITKETYDFIDKGSRNVTLRPEGTAGVVRQFIENKVYGEKEISKYWYYGPMFRYERPQSGRYRQFNQFGVEVFGSNDPLTDAEVISIMVNLFKLLGLNGVKVNLNTLGDTQSREKYRDALIDYFKPYIDELCDDCKERFKTNPLRILDCKIDENKNIMKNAPKTTDYLNEASYNHFENVKKYLTSMGIDFIVNPSIVRGLDYYTHTVFEVEATVKDFGSQNVLGGGGRYDSLVKNIGGPDTPGVGFAIGTERLLLALEKENKNIISDENLEIYIIPVAEKEYAISLANNLRLNGFSVDIDLLNKNMKSNFKMADKYLAKFIIIVGEKEVSTEVLTIKDNNTKEEFKVHIDELINFLDERLGA